MWDRAAQTGGEASSEVGEATPPQIRNFREPKGIQSVWKARARNGPGKGANNHSMQGRSFRPDYEFFSLSCERWEAIEHRGEYQELCLSFHRCFHCPLRIHCRQKDPTKLQS